MNRKIAITFKEAAQQFVDNYTKQPLKIFTAPMGIMKIMGWFSLQMHFLAKILGIINNYPEQFEAQPTWEELGKPTITVAKFARRISHET